MRALNDAECCGETICQQKVTIALPMQSLAVMLFLFKVANGTVLQHG